jgi:hypothetical protein
MVRDLCSPDDNNKFQQQKQSMNSAVAALYIYRDTLVKSCVTAIEEVLKAIRLTQTQIGSQAFVETNTELHPITGYVLCFCKEIIEFESIYQEMLEISVSFFSLSPCFVITKSYSSSTT